MEPGSGWVLLWIVFFILIIPKFRYAAANALRPTVRDVTSRVRQTTGTALTSGSTKDPALRILRERFARGEIDRAEYEERRDVLLTPVPEATPRPMSSSAPVVRI